MKAAIVAACLLAAPVRADLITPDALDTLPDADVIFLGEVHDNPAHHSNQARAIAAIDPAALVFEMLTAAQAAAVPDVLPDAATLSRLLDWDASGWPDFTLYYPLFRAASSALIYGAEVPREDARLAMSIGVAEHFGADAARFGLSAPLPPEEQEAREAVQARAHCDALPAEILPGMVEIQRLRDATLARSALQAYDETGGPVIVITGTGHARTDWGAPVALRNAAPDLRILSIGQFEEEPGDAPPFDLWLVTDPHPRPDPCEAFR